MTEDGDYETIEEYFNEKFFDNYLPYHVPYELVIQDLIIELGLIYDELLWECDELVKKPDPSLTKDEAIAKIKDLHKQAEMAYDGLLNDYWPSKEKKEWKEASILNSIKDDAIHTRYLEKYL